MPIFPRTPGDKGIDETSEKLIDVLYDGGPFSKVQQCLAAGADPRYNYGYPLELAAARGNPEALEALIAAGADPTVDKSMALRMCAYRGGPDKSTGANPDDYVACAKLLVAAGADPHSQVDFALRWAARSGCTKMVEYLLAFKPDLHAMEDSALVNAVERKHVGVVRALLNAGANLTKIKPEKLEALGLSHGDYRSAAKTVLKMTEADELGEPVFKPGDKVICMRDVHELVFKPGDKVICMRGVQPHGSTRIFKVGDIETVENSSYPDSANIKVGGWYVTPDQASCFKKLDKPAARTAAKAVLSRKVVEDLTKQKFKVGDKVICVKAFLIPGLEDLHLATVQTWFREGDIGTVQVSTPVALYVNEWAVSEYKDNFELFNKGSTQRAAKNALREGLSSELKNGDNVVCTSRCVVRGGGLYFNKGDIAEVKTGVYVGCSDRWYSLARLTGGREWWFDADQLDDCFKKLDKPAARQAAKAVLKVTEDRETGLKVLKELGLEAGDKVICTKRCEILGTGDFYEVGDIAKVSVDTSHQPCLCVMLDQWYMYAYQFTNCFEKLGKSAARRAAKSVLAKEAVEQFEPGKTTAITRCEAGVHTTSPMRGRWFPGNLAQEDEVPKYICIKPVKLSGCDAKFNPGDVVGTLSTDFESGQPFLVTLDVPDQWAIGYTRFQAHFKPYTKDIARGIAKDVLARKVAEAVVHDHKFQKGAVIRSNSILTDPRMPGSRRSYFTVNEVGLDDDGDLRYSISELGGRHGFTVDFLTRNLDKCWVLATKDELRLHAKRKLAQEDLTPEAWPAQPHIGDQVICTRTVFEEDPGDAENGPGGLSEIFTVGELGRITGSIRDASGFEDWKHVHVYVDHYPLSWNQFKSCFKPYTKDNTRSVAKQVLAKEAVEARVPKFKVGDLIHVNERHDAYYYYDWTKHRHLYCVDSFHTPYAIVKYKYHLINGDHASTFDIDCSVVEQDFSLATSADIRLAATERLSGVSEPLRTHPHVESVADFTLHRYKVGDFLIMTLKGAAAMGFNDERHLFVVKELKSTGYILAPLDPTAKVFSDLYAVGAKFVDASWVDRNYQPATKQDVRDFAMGPLKEDHDLEFEGFKRVLHREIY